MELIARANDGIALQARAIVRLNAPVDGLAPSGSLVPIGQNISVSIGPVAGVKQNSFPAWVRLLLAEALQSRDGKPRKLDWVPRWDHLLTA